MVPNMKYTTPKTKRVDLRGKSQLNLRKDTESVGVVGKNNSEFTIDEGDRKRIIRYLIWCGITSHWRRSREQLRRFEFGSHRESDG